MDKLFKRKVWKDLEYWKNNLSDRTALLLEGQRRVGKTTIVKEFVKRNYDSYIYIDFIKMRSMFLKILDNYDMTDLNGFFLYLQQKTNTRLVEGKSVIVFDEVQLCKEARQMIKVLVEDGRYSYIETGSLISIRQNIEGIVVPSDEYRIRMYPMDFEEFLWATGDTLTMDIVRKSFAERKPMGKMSHDLTNRKFMHYMLVGGMPGAVSTFIEKNNFDLVEDEKQSILELYREDLGKLKYSAEKCKAIFANIPGLLSKHDKTFKSNGVRRYSRMSDYTDAVNSLDESRIVNICRSCTDPGPAPGLNYDENGIKIYMSDTGLLLTAAFDANIGKKKEIYDMIIDNKMKVNRGMFFENIVAQELVTSGHKLYYSRFVTSDSTHTQEVDFIVAKDGKIIPVEVKSGNSTQHVSLDRFREKYAKRISEIYVVHTKDLRMGDDGIVYIPAYMACLIGKE